VLKRLCPWRSFTIRVRYLDALAIRVAVALPGLLLPTISQAEMTGAAYEQAREIPRRQTSQGSRDPNRWRPYAAFVAEAANFYVLPRSLLWAVMHVESNFNDKVISNKGAVGLMQLIPGTAKAMGVLDIYDPRQNVLGGARYLRWLVNKFQGDVVRVAAAYNAGPAAVERYRGVPPYRETRRYVHRVITYYRAYRKQLAD